MWWNQQGQLFIRCAEFMILEETGFKVYEENMTQVGDAFVAPTVSELGEALPSTVTINNENYMLTMDKFGRSYNICYITHGKSIGFQSDTEADARAKMILFLVTEGWLKW